MSNIFVVGPGRTGSMTFIRACEHLTNFTSGHETRTSGVGADRIAYPAQHIEADSRLVWFVGALDQQFGSRARYVIMRRDPDAITESYLRRWPPEPRRRRPLSGGRWVGRARAWWGGRRWSETIVEAFGHTVITRPYGLTDSERRQVCADYVRSVYAMLDVALQHRDTMDFRLEEARSDFPGFVSWAGAEGDLDGALQEWSVRHNASDGM